ncbi:MAG: AAA family ATPase [Ruminococcus sp.]|nr:AAA family ATPase [Ruminococcus sp.]
MSVIVQVFGAKHESEEYQCALKLKEIFQNELPQSTMGEIYIQANATLFGQTVKDLDIIVMGTLQNYCPNVDHLDKEGKDIYGSVEINSFCTAIEIKSHSPKGVWRKGSDFFVKYKDHEHSVTEQSNSQKIAVMNFFTQSMKSSPFITNVIWFTGLTKNDISTMLKMEKDRMKSNALPYEFTLADFIQLLVWQKKPSFYKGKYHFQSCYDGQTSETLSKQFQLFAMAKKSMGELTRKRIEQITSKTISSSIDNTTSDKMSILRGRAGTGKTIALIQKAISIAYNENARVVILTYNKALVSDIRRLFALAELPDMFSEHCVSVTTIHSYFYKITSKCLYDDKLDSEEFISNYYKYIMELLDFMNADTDSCTVLKEILYSDASLNWEYCFIDEAQDWSSAERDIILQLYAHDHIIVADGGQQFVRNIEYCDWNVVKDRSNIRLKQCLRQKNNIIKFVNNYIESYSENANKIAASDKMIGGDVYICSSIQAFWKISDQLKKDLKSSGNIMYDMLCLTPPSLVEKEPRHFKLQNEFSAHGIDIWDGTITENRAVYSVYGDQVRVLQYDSSRGLEGWTVICLDFDAFIDEKLECYAYCSNDNTSLLLESEEDRRIKYILNWVLIPFTRAIDTLVIVLRDKDSETALKLKAIAECNPDFITYIEE